MCMAKNYANEIMDTLKKVEKEMKSLNIRLSELDKAQEDILHTIESFSFNACQGYKMTARLKELRSERRLIKNEINTLQRLMDFKRTCNKWLRDTIHDIDDRDRQNEYRMENRVYNYRVLTKDEILA